MITLPSTLTAVDLQHGYRSMVRESLAARLWAGSLDKVMAARKRHSPEQIVRKLMAADRLLAEGEDTAAVCRELGVSEARITAGATSSVG
jgi:hypothetical protein